MNDCKIFITGEMECGILHFACIACTAKLPGFDDKCEWCRSIIMRACECNKLSYELAIFDLVL